ncbi:spore germination protein GerPC [Gorillibacterium sp. CAU 1737]|uniref:spore germination protein GerPC n=1 Tax=Gorillibacterium sp. CAU 1737 TaxID=3140362 RepID=UPI00325FE34E
MMPWEVQLCRLEQQLAWQSGMILELQRMVQQLMEQVEKLQAVPHTKIDRIEYQFDQLKVEKLEGALHIGISPPGTSDLLAQQPGGGWEAVGWKGGVSPEASFASTDSTQEPYRSIRRYMEEEVPHLMNQLAEESPYVFPDAYLHQMKRSLESQIEERVAHYLRQTPEEALNADEIYLDRIAAQVQRDVEAAIRIHFAERKEENRGNPG